MTGYFEVILQRMFSDQKKLFMNSEYFRALFAEDSNKDSLEKKYQDDSAKQTPVSLGGQMATSIIIHKRVGQKSQNLISPVPTPL